MSVNTEVEARRLLTLACPTNVRGEWVATELVEEQTLERLSAFGDRLEQLYQDHIVDWEEES